jgi:hypothetical protein
MRTAVLALALLPAAALAEDRVLVPAGPIPVLDARQCDNAKTQRVAQAPATVRVRPLNQEPLANRYLGVLRIEDGCDKPVKVAEQIGTEQR